MPPSPTSERSINQLSIVVECSLVADGTDVQLELSSSRRSRQVIEQTRKCLAGERSATRYEAKNPRAGLHLFDKLHRFDNVATLQSDEVPASSELDVTLHARTFLRELAETPMGQCNVVGRSH